MQRDHSQRRVENVRCESYEKAKPRSIRAGPAPKFPYLLLVVRDS